MHVCSHICIYPHVTSGPFCMTSVPFVNLAPVYLWACFTRIDKWEPTIEMSTGYAGDTSAGEATYGAWILFASRYPTNPQVDQTKTACPKKRPTNSCLSDLGFWRLRVEKRSNNSMT